jgi:hypothetical protein
MEARLRNPNREEKQADSPATIAENASIATIQLTKIT